MFHRHAMAEQFLIPRPQQLRMHLSEDGDVSMKRRNQVGGGCLWLPTESTFHISYSELKVAFFALKCFQAKLLKKHVRLLTEKSAAVACINDTGSSHSSFCNKITFSGNSALKGEFS